MDELEKIEKELKQQAELKNREIRLECLKLASQLKKIREGEKTIWQQY
jgi:hypothetical protein